MRLLAYGRHGASFEGGLNRIHRPTCGREDDRIAGVVSLQPVPLLTRIEKRRGIREDGGAVISHDGFAFEKEEGIRDVWSRGWRKPGFKGAMNRVSQSGDTSTKQMFIPK